jgi:nucleoside diphosphate kinase
MYTLINTFGNIAISDHRTLVGALKKQKKHAKAIRGIYGQNSYVTYKIVKSDDTIITRDEEIEAQIAAGIY